MHPKKLEQYKYFPHVAWTLSISFAGFVMMLALETKATYQDLHESQISHEYRLQQIEAALGTNPTTTTP